MDPLKEAFRKIKEDIYNLKEEIDFVKQQLKELLQNNNPTNNQSLFNQQTDKQTHSTHEYPLETVYTPNLEISIGNKGVPTDKQTNRQTDRHKVFQVPKEPFNQFEEILDSLDEIKKEIRRKFKRLTPQEIKVFSKLYTLEDKKVQEITYSLLAEELNLSGSSIRDYMNRLIKKGIPIEKLKKNNKTILLKISPNLKKMASLDTILKLRDL